MTNDERISKIEGNILAITNSVEALLEAQRITNQEVRDLAKQHAGMSAVSGRVPMVIIFSACTLCLALVGSAAAIGKTFIAQEFVSLNSVATLSRETVSRRLDNLEQNRQRDEDQKLLWLIEKGRILERLDIQKAEKHE